MAVSSPCSRITDRYQRFDLTDGNVELYDKRSDLSVILVEGHDKTALDLLQKSAEYMRADAWVQMAEDLFFRFFQVHFYKKVD